MLRARPISLLIVSLAVPGLTALPVVALPREVPAPVEPTLHTLPLTGVDKQAAASAPALTKSAATPKGGRAGAALTDVAPKDVALTAAVSTQPFRVVGVTWSAPTTPEGLVAYVRTRSDGKWSSWAEIPTGDDHGPDADSAEAAQASSGQRAGTDPLFVEESDGVQVRVRTSDGKRPRGLRVDLVDPGESAADAAVGVRPAGAAQAAVSQPQIFSRADWGADENLKTGGAEYGVIKGGFVHHTAGANTYTEADVPGIIRGIYAYHVQSRGWRDIGYNFVVDKFGRVWEGRYGGIDKAVIGAHTLGYNHESFAMSTLGTLTTVEPTSATLAAYARIFAWKFDLSGVDPQSTVTLNGTNFQAISGHRDAAATECPGERLYAKLATIRSDTSRLMTASSGPVDPVTVDEVYPRPSDGVFDITGHGWGHALGLSQYGARGAAGKGLTHQEILDFYYPGTTLSNGYTKTIRVRLEGETDSDVRGRPESGLVVRYYPQGSATSKKVTLPTTLSGKSVSLWRSKSWKNDVVIQGWTGSGWTYLLSGRYVDGEKPVDFIASDGHVQVADATTGRRTLYRGWMRTQRSGGSMIATNYVPLEYYLRSVVPSEMPNSWAAQALQAQSVAARSYALAEAASRSGGTFDVYDSTRSQVYRGYGLYDSSWKRSALYEASSTNSAVSATAGKVLTHDAAVARTSFSSSNGGLTSGAGGFEWEVTRLDPYDRLGGSSRNDWTDSASASSLEARYPAIGRLEQIRVTRRSGAGDWQGRVLSLRLEGSSGTATVSGDSTIRSVFGTNSSYLTFS